MIATKRSHGRAAWPEVLARLLRRSAICHGYRGSLEVDE